MALLECGMELDSGSSSDESIADLLIDEACKPFARQRLQEIGPERLSLERLQREARERGFEPDDLSTSIWSKYMFRLADLPAVVEALDPPPGFRTPSGLFSGEEGVLLLLRRFRTTDALAPGGAHMGNRSRRICYLRGRVLYDRVHRSTLPVAAGRALILIMGSTLRTLCLLPPGEGHTHR